MSMFFLKDFLSLRARKQHILKCLHTTGNENDIDTMCLKNRIHADMCFRTCSWFSVKTSNYLNPNRFQETREIPVQLFPILVCPFLQ